jgi:hypothetical protein
VSGVGSSSGLKPHCRGKLGAPVLIRESWY